MYQEAFEKLELAETATVLDEINPLLEGSAFDPVETTILAADIPFYPGCRLLDIGNHTVMPPVRRFVVYSRKKSVVLNFSNEVIYKFNSEWPIKLDESNVGIYVRFFFTYVRGKHGRFLIVENVDDVPWKEDPPPTARQAVGKMIKPITLKESDIEDEYKLQIHLVFRDSLFKSDVTVKKDGLVALSNEELLLENLPVLDDTLGQ